MFKFVTRVRKPNYLLQLLAFTRFQVMGGKNVRYFFLKIIYCHFFHPFEQKICHGNKKSSANWPSTELP